MAALTSERIKLLTITFLESDVFGDDRTLANFVKTIPDFKPWWYEVPGAYKPKERATAFISTFFDRRRPDGRTALDIFIVALADYQRIGPGREFVVCLYCGMSNDAHAHECRSCSASLAKAKEQQGVN